MNKKKEELIKYLFVILGTVVYTLGLNLFVTPMHLYSGGVMGISQILRTVFTDKLGIRLGDADIAGIIYYIFNVPLLIMAYKKLSKQFFFKTIISVTFMMIIMALIPVPEPIVSDMLTGCIIGGMACGAGIGMVLIAGGSGGGFDIVATYLAKNHQNLSVGKVSLFVNIIIYVICAILFNVETAIYSVIMSAVSNITIDRVHYQNIMIQAMIITKVDGLDNHVMEKTGRGITEVKGEGAYTGDDVHILITVISKYEMNIVRKIVQEYDPHAFVSYTKLSGLEGNFKKRLL